MSAAGRPSAVFFDWDGTLADSFNFLLIGHNEVLAHFGLPALSAEDYRANHFGAPREKIYKDLYGAHHQEAHDLFGAFVVREHARLLKPMEGAGAVIDLLRRHKVPLGVISNKKPDYIHLEIAAFGWKEAFQAVVGAGMAAEDKPSGLPILLASEQLGLREELRKIWYVGDTEIDVRAAQNAAVPAIYIHEEHETHDWLARYKPLMVVKNFAALHQFLLQSLEN